MLNKIVSDNLWQLILPFFKFHLVDNEFITGDHLVGWRPTMVANETIIFNSGC